MCTTILRSEICCNTTKNRFKVCHCNVLMTEWTRYIAICLSMYSIFTIPLPLEDYHPQKLCWITDKKYFQYKKYKKYIQCIFFLQTFIMVISIFNLCQAFPFPWLLLGFLIFPGLSSPGPPSQTTFNVASSSTFPEVWLWNCQEATAVGHFGAL